MKKRDWSATRSTESPAILGVSRKQALAGAPYDRCGGRLEFLPGRDVGDDSLSAVRDGRGTANTGSCGAENVAGACGVADFDRDGRSAARCVGG